MTTKFILAFLSGSFALATTTLSLKSVDHQKVKAEVSLTFAENQACVIKGEKKIESQPTPKQCQDWRPIFSLIYDV